MFIDKVKRKISQLTKPRFFCPICSYNGIFKDVNPETGYRRHSRCPQCGSAERHRLQKLVLDQIFEDCTYENHKILHFAPEAFFEKLLKNKFQDYTSCDLYMDNVSVQADITNLPFNDDTFDFIFASHVLEHIKDDMQAIKELKRVLKPGGIAVLPVPVISDTTIEYPEPNPYESDHVRAPGKDYFDRYEQVFSKVHLYHSSDFSEKYQTFVYEDRSHYPNERSPLRQPSYERKYEDIVPVCFY